MEGEKTTPKWQWRQASFALSPSHGSLQSKLVPGSLVTLTCLNPSTSLGSRRGLGGPSHKIPLGSINSQVLSPRLPVKLTVRFPSKHISHLCTRAMHGEFRGHPKACMHQVPKAGEPSACARGKQESEQRRVIGQRAAAPGRMRGMGWVEDKLSGVRGPARPPPAPLRPSSPRCSAWGGKPGRLAPVPAQIPKMPGAPALKELEPVAKKQSRAPARRMAPITGG